MAQSTSVDGTPLGDMISLVSVLQEPTLARIYSSVRQTEDATVGELVEAVSVPERTAYEYVNTLVESGFLEPTTEGRPIRYRAKDIEFTLQTPDGTRQVTSELVDAVGRRETNEDIDIYIERHGIDGLATALQYTRDYVAGTVTHRIMARELDISPLEASIILQALRDVVETATQCE